MEPANEKDFKEAVDTQHVVNIDDDTTKGPAVKEKAVHSVALTAAIEAQKPSLWSKNMLTLYAIMGIGYLVSTMNGFDSSLMGSINAMSSYQKTFGLDGAGSTTGIIFIIYNCGQIAAFPFCGFFADGYGRRICIFVGCLLVLVGTAIQTSANSMGQFIGGRFVLGFGANIASAAGPAYTVELAHPAYRGTMAGMYNNFWWLGNILAGWTTYGTDLHFPESSWAWRTPTLVQCALPSVVVSILNTMPGFSLLIVDSHQMCLVLFFPETPRWLIMKDRREEAAAILAKYHGDGDLNAPIVTLQIQEIIADMANSRNDNPWWDFKVNNPHHTPSPSSTH